MNFPDFIQDFLIEEVTTYKNYFKKTYQAALIFSLFTVIASCLLILTDQTAILGYIHRYSFLSLFMYHIPPLPSNYLPTDLFKFTLLLFSAIFAIGFVNTKDSGKLKFSDIISAVNMNAIGNLLLAIIGIVLLDIILYFAESSLRTANNGFERYLVYPLDIIRPFIQLVLLIIAVSISLFGRENKITFKATLYFWTSSIIYAAIMYQVNLIFEQLVIYPFKMAGIPDDTKFLIQIFLAVPILSIFVLGYAVLLYFPIRNYCLKTVNYINDEIEEEGENGNEELSK